MMAVGQKEQQWEITDVERLSSRPFTKRCNEIKKFMKCLFWNWTLAWCEWKCLYLPADSDSLLTMMITVSLLYFARSKARQVIFSSMLYFHETLYHYLNEIQFSAAQFPKMFPILTELRLYSGPDILPRTFPHPQNDFNIMKRLLFCFMGNG